MAGGNHDRPVKLVHRHHRGHEHGRRGRQTRIRAARPQHADAPHHVLLQILPGKPGIRANADVQVVLALAQLQRQPVDERLSNGNRVVAVQVHLFPFHAGKGDAPNIAAVLQIHNIFHIDTSNSNPAPRRRTTPRNACIFITMLY